MCVQNQQQLVIIETPLTNFQCRLNWTQILPEYETARI